uniref:Uncharacterized protein n=1 Tax=Arundo donax TaxID=35708 RepID=A0A0A9A476_ARUDO
MIWPPEKQSDHSAESLQQSPSL